ncbi:hypothetical protein [Streptomyces sp900116325]|uniref:hypothetical protein n=1 Tax=Streptomyces sp. 900116325 TaxID=3154295 RepID=UPI0033A6F942
MFGVVSLEQHSAVAQLGDCGGDVVDDEVEDGEGGGLVRLALRVGNCLGAAG